MYELSNNILLDVANPINKNHPLNQGLVAEWACIPGLMGGAKLHDLLSSGDLVNGNHGTLTNGATWNGLASWYNFEPPCNAGSIGFDGIDDYVTAGVKGMPSGTGPRTIAYWQFQRTMTNNVQAASVAMEGSSGNSFTITPIQIGGTYYIWTDSVTTNLALGSSAEAPALNKWQHILISWDGSNVRYYLNGKYINFVAYSGTIATLVSTNIGKRTLGAVGYFDGFISNVSIYNRCIGTLNPDREVESLYAESLRGNRNRYNYIPLKTYSFAAWRLNRNKISAPTESDYSKVIDCANPINKNCELNNGLVADWTVIPGLSGGAKLINLLNPGDLVNGNNGTLTNGPVWSTLTPPGGRGSLKTTVASSNYVALSNWFGSSRYSLIAVFQPWALSGAQEITAADDSVMSLRAFQFRTNANNLEGISFDTTPNAYTATGATTLVNGTWYYVAMTNDGTTLRIYLNGIQDGSAALAGTVNTSASPWAIGARLSGGNPAQPSSHYINMVGAYNRALSAAEVAALYNEFLAGNPNRYNYIPNRTYSFPLIPPVSSKCSISNEIESNSVVIDYANPINKNCPLTQGLVGYWSVVPGLAGGAKLHNLLNPGDLVNGLHGDLVNRPVWRGCSPFRNGGSLNFASANSMYVNCGNATSLQITGSTIWVWAWVYIQGLVGTGQCVFAKDKDTGGRAWTMDLNGGPWRFYINGGSGTGHLVSGTTLALNKWYFLCGAFDGSNVYIWLNGKPDGNATGGSPTTIPSATANVTIGAREYAAFEDYLDGFVAAAGINTRFPSNDEVAALYNEFLDGNSNFFNYISNKAFSFPVTKPELSCVINNSLQNSKVIDYANPINKNCSLTQGLVGYWAATPGLAGGSKLHNLLNPGNLNNGFHGTLTNGPKWSQLSSQNSMGSLIFDGSDDYVDMGDIGSNYFSKDFTISIWLWQNETAVATQFAVSKEGNTGSNGWALFSRVSNNRMEFRLNNGGGGPLVGSDNSFTTKQWRHCVVTRVGSLCTMYMEGNVVGTATVSTDISYAASLQLGQVSWSPGTIAWHGYLGDIAIWPTRGLSKTEVKLLYFESISNNPNFFNYIPLSSTETKSPENKILVQSHDAPTKILDTANPINWASPLNKGLVARWEATPGLSGGAKLINLCNPGDLVNGLHGDLTNGVTWSGLAPPGVSGSLNFDGSDDVVLVPDSSSMNPANAISVAVWFKCTNVTSSNRFLVHKGDAATFTNSSYELYLSSNGGVLRFEISDGSGAWTTAASIASYADSLWHHVVGTYARDLVTLYVDGKSVGTSGAMSSAIVNDTNQLAIGGRSANNSGQDFLGQIASVAIYNNRSLSASEVASLYADQLQGSPQTLNFIPLGRVSTTPILDEPNLTANNNKLILWNDAVTTGTSTVNQNRLLEWNVLDRINKSDLLEWNDIGRVGVADLLLWNDLLRVNQSNNYLWNDLLRLNTSKLLEWNENARIGQSKLLEWNDLGRVGIADLIEWNLNSRIGTSDLLLWSLGGSVNKTNLLLWNDLLRIDNSKLLEWNEYSRINKSDLLEWNLLGNVGKSNLLLWGLGGSISKSLLIDWNDLLRLDNSKNTLWNETSRVSKSDLELWNVITRVSKNPILLWNDLARIGVSRNLSWNDYLRIASSPNKLLLWSLSGHVSKSNLLLWHLLTNPSGIVFDYDAIISEAYNSEVQIRPVFDYSV